MLPKLTSFNLKPINVSTLPLPQDGWRLAMLVQYPENPAWTITTCLTKSISFRGMTLRVSSWNPTQVATRTEYPEHRSVYLEDGVGGCTLEKAQALINDGFSYCYLHDTLEPPIGFDTPVLSISEYQELVLKAPVATQTTVQEPIHAG